MLLSTISFIYYLIHFKRRKSDHPTLESMLAEVNERLKGPKIQHWFLEGRGWGTQGKGIGMSTMQKGAILRKCLNTYVPHCTDLSSAVQ